MYATILFNICKGPSDSMKEYLVCFNEETIKVIHPNQGMFVEVLQNGVRVGHFNESLS